MVSDWYVIHPDIHGPALRGPYSLDDLLGHLRAGSIYWVDWIYDPRRSGPPWVRAHELPELRVAMPALPDEEARDRLVVRIRAASASPSEAAPLKEIPETQLKEVWYLQMDGTEFGPFVSAELEALRRNGKLKWPIYCWKKGMASWQAVRTPDEMGAVLKGQPSIDPHRAFRESASPPGGRANQRDSNRRALVATISMIDGGRRSQIGVCNDISLSGIQVVGVDASMRLGIDEVIELEIAPLAASGLRPLRIKARLAWAVPRRVGFTFVLLGAAEQQALESYIRKV